VVNALAKVEKTRSGFSVLCMINFSGRKFVLLLNVRLCVMSGALSLYLAC